YLTVPLCFNCSIRNFKNVNNLNKKLNNVAQLNCHVLNQSKLSVDGYYRQVRCFTSESKDNLECATLLEKSPSEFVTYLQKCKIKRCHIIYDRQSKKAKASHRELQELADYMNEESNEAFKDHEGIFFQVGMRSGCLLSAFLWNTTRGQAVGGIRLWRYKTVVDYLKDGLRLSHAMGIKSALAGLWNGGGKGIIAEPPENQHLVPDFRQKMFFDYGDFLTSLNGCFIPGDGAGICPQDIMLMYQRSRYVSHVSSDNGGLGNPSEYTAYGVVCAMEAALDFLDMGSLDGKTIAIQGTGNVATILIEDLLEKGVEHIYVTDCNQKRIDDVNDAFAQVGRDRLVTQKVPIDDNSVLAYPCDILSPCAVGNVLTKETIPQIHAKIVCGAANNQLGCDKDDELLAENGVTYIVDSLANRMGIVQCASEIYGRLPNDPAILRHFDKTWENSIYVMVKRILQTAKDENITPAVAATRIADTLNLEPNPIWPNRAHLIVESLVKDGWSEHNDFCRHRTSFPGTALQDGVECAA
ncbi:unnamed protein product, partial [Owenia fusiformis]